MSSELAGGLLDGGHSAADHLSQDCSPCCLLLRSALSLFVVVTV